MVTGAGHAGPTACEYGVQAQAAHVVGLVEVEAVGEGERGAAGEGRQLGMFSAVPSS